MYLLNVESLTVLLDFSSASKQLNTGLLHLNDSKTEVLLVSPSKVSSRPLTQYLKRTVANLGIKMNQNLKLDKHVSAVVKIQLFPSEATCKRHNFEILMHAFDWTIAILYMLASGRPCSHV